MAAAVAMKEQSIPFHLLRHGEGERSGAQPGHVLATNTASRAWLASRTAPAGQLLALAAAAAAPRRSTDS